MNRSALTILILIVFGGGIAAYIALSESDAPIEPRPTTRPTKEQAPIDTGDSSAPTGPLDSAPDLGGGGNLKGGNLGSGNLPGGNQVGVSPPPEVAPPVASDEVFVVPVVDETLQSLKQIAAGELSATAARDALLRGMSAMERQIDDERARAFLQALTFMNDESLNKRVITSSSIYLWPAIREQLRQTTSSGQLAALVQRESRIADASSIDWLRHSQLEAPDDVFNGITRYMNNVATLIRGVDPALVPDGDQKIIQSLKALKHILRDTGGINLGEQLRGKIQGIAAERLALYEALFSE